MNIQITLEQNVIVDGVEYVAQKSEIMNGCIGCHFQDQPVEFCGSNIDCFAHYRLDRTNVIFIKKDES